MQRKNLIYLTLFIIFTYVTGCDDSSGSGSGLDESSSPVLILSADNFPFPSLEPGSARVTREVTVSNTGAAVLKLAMIDARFNNPSSYILDWYRNGDSENPLIGIDPIQGNVFEGNINISPGENLTFKLIYTPDVEGAGGAVTFLSNDPDNSSITLPIEGTSASADLIVTPATVDFGRVNAGMVVTQEVTVTNVGTASALVDGIALNGSMDFSVMFNGEDPIANPGILSDPDQDEVAGISSANEMILSVTYEPLLEGPDFGELIIVSGGLEINVPLTANAATPCINLIFPETVSSDPNSIEFGPSLINATTTQEVVVESCGGEALSIEGIRLEGSETYALGDGVPPMYPALLSAATDGDRPTRSFNLNFSPTEAEVYEGTLIIDSNDPVNSELRIPILGLGTVNACPVAAVTTPEVNVLPLELITLDASPSVDADGPGGRPVRYDWVVTQRPMGSTAQPVERFTNPLQPADGGVDDDVTTPQAQFFVDLAGEYVIELTVTDELGFSAPSDSCPQADATIYINSLPDEDIHVELVWTTPNDSNETDSEGTDVDLHFLHPEGFSWSLPPLDCYYGNKTPDWGPSGPVGNPSLDIDDTNGAGPENINLDDPQFTDQTSTGGPYRIGVHYYSSGGFFGGGLEYGASDVTIKVYLFSVLEAEWTRRLNTTDNFWEVAGIIWTQNEKRVQEINRFYDFIP